MRRPFESFSSGLSENTNKLSTVYPKKYAHGFRFAVLCCGYTLIYCMLMIAKSWRYPLWSLATVILRCCGTLINDLLWEAQSTVYHQKYAHGFVVLCFVVVMQSFIMNSQEVFIHIHHGCFAGTGAIVRLPQCQWSKPDGYGKISQCITTTKHSKAKTVCILLGIYCIWQHLNDEL